MSNSLYYALFWALGIILMGIYVRIVLRKKKLRQPNRKIGKSIIIFLFVTAGSIQQAADLSPVYESASSLLNIHQPNVIHPSLWLRDILLQGHALPDSIRQQLRERGFRIHGYTRPFTDRPESNNLDLSLDANIFRFHYTLNGTNAISATDVSGNGIPDYLDSVITIFNKVYSQEIETMGYDLPPDDGNYPPGSDNGGSAHYDVYIRNLSSGYYGYVQGESEVGDNPNSVAVQEVNAWTSYMAIRNNYDGFPNTEMNNISVTVAHEFFHAIQYGYDAWEKNWLLEATAVWMEEAVFDNINDCYQYLPSWFAQPHLAVNPENGNRWYGSYIFFEYMTAHLGGPDIVRKIYEASRLNDSYGNDDSKWVIDNALAQEASGFVDAYTKMAIANRILSSSVAAGIYRYDEAESYPVYPDGPAVLDIVRFSQGSADTVFSTNLEPFGSNYIFLASDDPLKVILLPETGNSSDFALSAIMKTADDHYYIKNGSVLNIDPATNGFIWMYLVVSSITNRDNYHYNLILTDGQREEETIRPFTVSHPQPNPFQSEVSFQVISVIPQSVSIKIFSVTGQLVRTLFSGDWGENETYTYHWNGLNTAYEKVGSGSYFIQITSDQSELWLPITCIR